MLCKPGILHDCIPKEPFADPAQYNAESSCIQSRLGPCGIYDEYGRRDSAIWQGPDGENYTWIDYRAIFPDLRPRFTAQIAGALPVTFQNFDVFINELNVYSGLMLHARCAMPGTDTVCSGNYNLTRAGNFTFSILFVADGRAPLISLSFPCFCLLTPMLTCMAARPGTTQHISGSPFQLQVTGGLTAPRNSLLTGQGFLSAMLGHPGRLRDPRACVL